MVGYTQGAQPENLKARRKLGWDNEVKCEHSIDSPLGKCGCNVFSVFKDKETGEISLVCHWGHITIISDNLRSKEEA